MQKQEVQNIGSENKIVFDWGFLELILQHAEENYEEFLEEYEWELRS